VKLPDVDSDDKVAAAVVILPKEPKILSEEGTLLQSCSLLLWAGRT
jgi:hypothetical protein